MYIEELHRATGTSVTLKGWVSNKREGKGIVFIILRDGTGFCQCVVTEETAGAAGLQNAQNLSLESSVALTGNVVSDEKQIGGYELQVSSVCQKRAWCRIFNGPASSMVAQYPTVGHHAHP